MAPPDPGAQQTWPGRVVGRADAELHTDLWVTEEEAAPWFGIMESGNSLGWEGPSKAMEPNSLQ